MDSLSRYKYIVENLADFVDCHIPGGILTYVNNSLCVYCGMKAEELIGKSFYPFIHEEDRAKTIAAIESITPLNSFVTTENRVILPGRQIYWHRWSHRGIFDDQGVLIEYLSIGHDITEQKLVQEVLQKSEADLAESQRVAQMGNWSFDVITKNFKCSDELYNIFDIDKSTFGGSYESFLSRVHPEDKSLVLETNKRARGLGEDFEVEYRILSQAGGLKYIREVGHVDSDESKKVTRLFGVAQDITERKLSELALKESEERFRAIMALSPDIISIIDEHGVLLYNSPTAYTIHGYTDEDLAGRNTFDFFHPDDRENVANLFSKLLEKPSETVSAQYRFRNKDDSYVWMETTACNQLDNPLIRGIIATSRDISNRKATETEQLEMERKLLYAQKLESLGIMAGGIAHDFNNLLSAIIGNLDFAQRILPIDSSLKKYIENSMEAGHRAADLTKQMLAYSGKAFFELKLMNLNDIVTENAGLFRMVIPKNIAMNVKADDDLPLIMADPGQIQQVVMNLITNAVEAIGTAQGVIILITGQADCDSDCIEKSVLPEKQAPGKYVYVEVTDNGSGMCQDIKNRLFEPFYTTKFMGRGLGMAATQGIIRAHKGLILLASEENQGTSFRILFPVEGDTASEHRQNAAKTDLPTIVDMEGQGAILVVDDEECVRSLGVDYVRYLGYDVFEACNGGEAMEVFLQHVNEISVVLLDLTMPVMGGVETFHEMKMIKPDVRIILSSGYSKEAVAEQFPGDKPDAFIQKPFQMDELQQKIFQVLQSP